MEGGVGVAEVVVVMRWGREGSKGGMGKVVRRGGGRDANPHSPFKRTFLY